MVYDMGGGTFDVSLLELSQDAGEKPIYDVKEVEGDAHLGGDDADHLSVPCGSATRAGRGGVQTGAA